MEPTTSGQLTPAGRDAIRKSVAMELAPPMDPLLESCRQVAQAANKAGLSLQQFADAMNSLPIKKRCKASVIINHNPSRLPYWPIVATPEIGCFGRLRWINSMPSEGAWGRVWWSNQ